MEEHNSTFVTLENAIPILEHPTSEPNFRDHSWDVVRNDLSMYSYQFDSPAAFMYNDSNFTPHQLFHFSSCQSFPGFAVNNFNEQLCTDRYLTTREVPFFPAAPLNVTHIQKEFTSVGEYCGYEAPFFQPPFLYPFARNEINCHQDLPLTENDSIHFHPLVQPLPDHYHQYHNPTDHVFSQQQELVDYPAPEYMVPPSSPPLPIPVFEVPELSYPLLDSNDLIPEHYPLVDSRDHYLQTSEVEARQRKRKHKSKRGLKNNENNLLGHYKCILCDYFCKELNEFLDHLTSHTSSKGPFICPICSKDFVLIILWRNHVVSHMYLRPFKCDECAASYTTNGELKRHIRYKHGGGKPHKCKVCSYECVELAKLNRHQRMHTGEKPFKCPTCTYMSYDKSKIRRHYVTHSREKPFECEFCHSRFTQSGSLKTHLLNVHHLEKVEFRCAYCNMFVTRNMGELRNHMKLIHQISVFPVVINKDIVINPDSSLLPIDSETPSIQAQ